MKVSRGHDGGVDMGDVYTITSMIFFMEFLLLFLTTALLWASCQANDFHAQRLPILICYLVL